MSREVREYTVTIPKGTTAANPYKVQLEMPARVVVKITVRVPPGPRGHMGFAIGSAGLPVIPINAGGWIITDNATLPYVLTDYIDSGTWWVLGYNDGTYTHTIYLTFTCTLPGQAAAASAAPAAGAVIATLSSTGATPTPTPLPVPTAPPTPPSVPTPPGITLPTPPSVPTPGTIPTPPTAPTGATPGVPIAGDFQQAPSNTVRTYNGVDYVPIRTYADTLADLAAGTAVYLWTVATSQPYHVPDAATFRALEHTGTHGYPQFTSYTAGASSTTGSGGTTSSGGGTTTTRTPVTMATTPCTPAVIVRRHAGTPVGTTFTVQCRTGRRSFTYTKYASSYRSPTGEVISI